MAIKQKLNVTTGTGHQQDDHIGLAPLYSIYRSDRQPERIVFPGSVTAHDFQLTFIGADNQQV
ncbi:hypothetical protein D3C78_1568250 [compost metagenome]